MDNVTEELHEFFEWIWGTTEKGFVYLPFEHKGAWRKRMFLWPKQERGVVRTVLEGEALGANVFFAPALFSAASPVKDDVKGSWTLWVDFDGNAPESAPEPVPAPSLRVQSSIEGHEHWYWRMNAFIDNANVIDDRNRALAYTMNADTSGWDADQLLRPPFTTNRKRNKPVSIKEWDK